MCVCTCASRLWGCWGREGRQEQVSVMMKCSEKTPSSSSTRWPITATRALCISKTHSCLFHLHKTTERLSCYSATHTHTHCSHLHFSPFSQRHELWKRGNGTSNTLCLHSKIYTPPSTDTTKMLHTCPQVGGHVRNTQHLHSLSSLLLDVRTCFTALLSEKK